MSQKKVDEHKARKRRHGKAEKRERTLFVLEMFAWAFICVAIVGWIGYSVYAKIDRAQGTAQETVEFDASAVQNYVSGLTQD